ncbi:lactonase family protein [Halomonas eurihalina]|uniref:Lactonase family protein n=1 Tax=Halomonas eurihalina TaxID=42566 RepID=A0A5D9D904_HALER|nr:lactonase family protein [Halomonas eurihalina]MDR5860271.1 lactonase family protein [Halomonas eurihalina]TZG40306.1 lactonase family protein [Halomonas eurihalina]
MKVKKERQQRSGSMESPANERYLYVGTYSSPNTAPGGIRPSQAEGIYVYKMSLETGNLSRVQAIEADNPSYLAMAPSKRYVYCVNELGEDEEGAPLGRVSAYKIDERSGQLSLINTRSTQGTWPCHCAVHPSGDHLFAANYGTGTFTVFPLGDDGAIGPMSDQFQASGNGSGPDTVRQEGPHAHMMLPNPGAQHVFGVDLGGDAILAWELESATGKLVPGAISQAKVPSGSGCRHLVFHPDDHRAYVINELSSTIDVFDVDPWRGAFLWLQSISTLPQDTTFTRSAFHPGHPGQVTTGTNTAAALRIHPNGRWIYATNRGMDSIAMFEVDPESGKLTSAGWVQTQGRIPRGMDVEPLGTFLYVGNQNSDTIVVFRIKPDDGQLEGPVHVIDSPVPVDFAFGPFAA